MKKPIHVILKWNETSIFHEDAPDTILEHCKILNECHIQKKDMYVWWGKISVSGHLGMDYDDVNFINNQIKQGISTYLFLYCPDKIVPTMHVGNILEVSMENMCCSNQTPKYYKDLNKIYNIPFWFKLGDITKIPITDALKNLLYTNGQNFDPVCVNFYPQKVNLKQDINIFTKANLYQHLMEGIFMKCFKTGGVCTRSDKIKYNPNQIFIGCPFRKEYFNFINYVIKPVSSKLGYSTWIANESFKNIDIMCKVCGGIQSSAQAIIDITSWNSNVLFELGMLYGLGKNVLLIKHDDSDVPVDLKGIEYVEYDMNDFNGAKELLKKYLIGE